MRRPWSAPLPCRPLLAAPLRAILTADGSCGNRRLSPGSALNSPNPDKRWPVRCQFSGVRLMEDAQ